MVYLKNITTWERRLRVIAGVAAIPAGFALHGLAPTAYVIAASGAVAALSGALGFCPACALVGRKLKEPR
jgi:hypothetical protein